MNAFVRLVKDKESYSAFMDIVFVPLHLVFIVLFGLIAWKAESVLIFGLTTDMPSLLIGLAIISFGLVFHRANQEKLFQKYMQLKREYGIWISITVVITLVFSLSFFWVADLGYMKGSLSWLGILASFPILRALLFGLGIKNGKNSSVKND